MYQPAHFVETDRDTLHALIRAHPLGLLISTSANGPVADPVPFLVDPEAGTKGVLRAHLSRANPHWKLLAENPSAPVLVIFQGAESYITPSWYETKRETGKVVPTWNYVIVQVRGVARVHDDPVWVGRQIRDLTMTHEAGRAEPWQVEDAPERFIEAQTRGIVGIEIEIAAIDGKWKVSQNRPEADRVGVTAGLAQSPDGAAMAGLVRKHGGLVG
jgi:transcriptional regulator